ncbi:hypothetical protein JOD24_003021 [Kroppenstedtia sanguinis]|uniref:hypothetical protein n=1 Tax=Kroppenstedtia sanguinis TaxID=1380684 RepID=UPI003D225F1D
MFRTKHEIALVVALALLLIAVPRIPVSMTLQGSSLFALSWLAFAYLVIAANWRMVLQLDREKRQKDEKARRLRWLQAEKQKKSMAAPATLKRKWQRAP